MAKDTAGGQSPARQAQSASPMARAERSKQTIGSQQSQRSVASASSYVKREKSRSSGYVRVNDVPGPGQYDTKSDFGSRKDGAPKYSFSQANRSKSERKVFISRSHSQSFLGEQSPGPVYNVGKNLLDGPKFSVGTSNRGDVSGSGSVAPGPGAYFPKSSLSDGVPMYSFGGTSSSRKLNDDGSPGPIYKTTRAWKTTIKSSPSHGFGSQNQRPNGRSSNLANPAPGSHDIPETMGKDLPKWSFGSSMQRDTHGKVFISHAHSKHMQGSSPGPAEYQNKSSLEGPKYTMRPSTQTGSAIQFNNSPGPGAYMPKSFDELGSKPSYSIGGSAERSDHGMPLSPGPIYNPLPAKSARSAKVGTEERRGLASKSKTPGPGTYKPTIDSKGTKTLGGAAKYGFGTADRNVVSTKVFISREHDKGMGGQHSPGPAVYKPRGTRGYLGDAPKSSMHGINEALKNKPVGDAPGPGAYDIKGMFPDENSKKDPKGPSFSTADRARSARKVFVSRAHAKHMPGDIENPAPGAYEISGTNHGVSKYGGPAYTMGEIV